jgi:hypothetical protein
MYPIKMFSDRFRFIRLQRADEMPFDISIIRVRLKNQGVEFKKQHKTKTCILQMPYDNISQFYQWFLLKQYGLHVQNPLFQNHVTIVSGNESRIVTAEYGKLL